MLKTEARPSGVPRRRRRPAHLFSLFFAMLTVHGFAGSRPAGAECAAKVQRPFGAIARAARRTLDACVKQLDVGQPGFSVAGCLAGDTYGWVRRARDRALSVEARSCSGSELGYTSVPLMADAAERSIPAAARGLLGDDLDAALLASGADGAAARCQRTVLDRALRCAVQSIGLYVNCASARLARGTDDPFDLVGCKPRPDDRCDGRIAQAAAQGCAGVDPAVAFPGCTGDVARCARDNAERAASDAVNAAADLCGDVKIGALDPETRLRCFAPPPLEPIVIGDAIPMAPGVNPQSASWDDDNEHLFFNFTSPTTTGTQLGRVALDGGGFSCLTCATGAITGNLRVGQRFRDGRRLLVTGNNSPNPKWNVLECTPSVLDCQTWEMLPIRLPTNPDPLNPVQQYRVPHVTRDDGWFIWTEVRTRGPGNNLSAMGRLVHAGDHYAVEDARVISPPVSSLAIGTDSAVWRNFTQPFEAKDAPLRGGLDWVVAGTPNAGHYDNFAVDLTTGEVRRLSLHPDHDEGLSLTPDERWIVMSSARTDNRLEFLGMLPRPPYVDWMAFSLHFVAIAGQPGDGLSPGGNPNERDCYLDPWIVDRWFERGDYIGQRLLKPADGWASAAGGFEWSPDGTKVSVVETQWRRLHPPPDAPAWRMRVASLPKRVPIAPADVVPLVPTPEPTWAVRYEDWFVPDTFGDTVIPGAHSGTATIHNAFASVVQGSARVTFDGYSDDGESFLDGFEEIRVPVLVLNGAEYEVDLALRGRHKGRMKGALTYDFVNDVNSGLVTTTVDGRTLDGPHTCYEAGLVSAP